MMPREELQCGWHLVEHSANVTVPPDCSLHLNGDHTHAHRKKRERNVLETQVWARLGKALHAT